MEQKKGFLKSLKELLLFRPTPLNLLLIVLMIGLDIGGHYLTVWITMPFWLDLIGAIVAAIRLGPLAGMLVGGVSSFLTGVIDDSEVTYCMVGVVVGLIIGLFFPRKQKNDMLVIISVAILSGLVSALLSTTLDIVLYDGYTGNAWGDALCDMLSRNVSSQRFVTFAAEAFVDIPDRVVSMLIALLIIRFLDYLKEQRKRKGKLKATALILVILFGISVPTNVIRAENYDSDYETVTYDSEDGILTAEVNSVAQTPDGYLWVGTYSGLYQYDGIHFSEVSLDSRIKNAMRLFVDSRGRLWIGTNDSGVFCYDTESGLVTGYGKAEGLSADSVRTIGEDGAGNIYVGTVQYVSVIDPAGKIRTHSEWGDIVYIRDFEDIGDGYAAGITTNGLLFVLKDGEIVKRMQYEGAGDIQFQQLAYGDGKLMVGTSGKLMQVYRVEKGELTLVNEREAETLSYSNQMRYSERDQGVFLCYENGMGFLDSSTEKVTNMTLPDFHGAVSDVCVDDQGNVWFASSKYGLLKYSKSFFKNVFHQAEIQDSVVNALYLSGKLLYIGMDTGIRILDTETGHTVYREWQKELEGDRVRHITEDSSGNLWISSFGKSGLVRIGADGSYTNLDAENDYFLGGKGRSVLLKSDGQVFVAGKNGLYILKDGHLTQRLGSGTSLWNQSVLTMVEDSNGSVYVGTDGNGVYEIISDGLMRHITSQDGLASGVVLRIVPCTGGFIYVTSNALFFDDGVHVRELKNFPYSNNYDVLTTSDGTCYIPSSAGLFMVKEDVLLKDEEYTCTLLNSRWGLATTFTANSWNVLKDDELLLCCTDGVRSLPMGETSGIDLDFKMHLKQVETADQVIRVQGDSVVIPAMPGRIQLHVAVNNYTLSNPLIRYYLEGLEDEGITCHQNEMTALSFNNLPYGDYKLHIEIIDEVTGFIEKEKVVEVKKEALRYETIGFRLYLFLVAALFVTYICWLFFSIHKRSQRIRGLQKEMSTDPMTGLFNKAASERELKAACETETGILMMIDLDSFKLVNDLYGHDMGDRILIRFAELIRECTNEGDVAGRLGGDEFVAFVRDTVDRGDVERITAHLNREIVKSAKEYMGPDMNIPLGASIGAVRVPSEGRKFEKLFKMADMELYIVKKNGKHGFSLYEKKDEDADNDAEKTDRNNLQQIKKIIGERNEGKGAYLVNFERLQVIYKYMNRDDKVNGTKTGIVRIIPSGENGQAFPDELKDSLEETLVINLRKNDVVSRYAGCFFILFSGDPPENCEERAKGIVEKWKSSGDYEAYSFSYETEQVGE